MFSVAGLFCHLLWPLRKKIKGHKMISQKIIQGSGSWLLVWPLLPWAFGHALVRAPFLFTVQPVGKGRLGRVPSARTQRSTMVLCPSREKATGAWGRQFEGVFQTPAAREASHILEAAVREHKGFAISIAAASSPWASSHEFQKDDASFLIDTLEAFFVAQSQTFLGLAGQKRCRNHRRQSLQASDTVCEVRQGWVPLSGTQSRGISCSVGRPITLSLLRRKTDTCGSFLGAFSPSHSKAGLTLPEEKDTGSTQTKESKHWWSFWNALSSWTHASLYFTHLS